MSELTKRVLPELDIGQLSISTGAITRQISVMEAQLEMQAKELCTAFTEARTEIQRSLGEVTTKAEFKERFAPLVVHSRVHKGSLEITWSLQKGKTKPVGNAKGKRILEYLRKGKGFGYKLPDLMSFSRDYELLIVVETEKKATRLREMWAKVVALRVALRTVGRLCEDPAQQAAPGAASVQPAPIESRSPDVSVPTGRLAASEQAVLSHEFDKSDLGASVP